MHAYRRFPNILLFAERYKFQIGLLFLVLALWPNVAQAIAPLVVIGAIGVGAAILKGLNFGAGTLDKILNIVTNIPAAILIGGPVMFLQLTVGILTDIVVVIAGAVNAVLKAVIQSTLQIPVANGEPGSALQIGQNITRNIANMLLLLILAIIGLATILRFQSYQLQQTLPRLLLIALLINFSGVFVGFVVDVANLITNFFVEQLTSFNAVMNQITAILKNTEALFLNAGNLFDDPDKYIAGIIQPLANSLAILIFALVFVLSLFVAMLLFIIRFGILWILSILAPLAFAAAVLPATRRFWNQWLQQLIQWALVGIPMAFFLYLANFVAVKSHFSNISVAGFGEIIVALIEPLITILFIVVGFGLSMSLAPAGAQGVINFGKKAGIGLGLAAGTAAWRRVGSPLEGGMEKARAWAEKQEGLGAEKMRSGGLGFVTGGLQRLGGTATKLGATGYGLGFGKLSELTRAHDEPEIGAERKAGQNIAAVDNIQEIATEMAKGPLANMNKVIGRVMALGDNGDTNDLYDELAKPGGKLNWDNMARAYDAAKQRGTPFRRHMEKMFIADVLDEKDELGNITKQNRLGVSVRDQDAILEMGRITPQDISSKLIDPRSLDPDTPQGPRTLETLMKAQGNTLMPAISRIPNREIRNRIGSRINSMNPQWFVDNNVEDILVWSTSPAAQSIGVKGIGGLDTKTKVDAFLNNQNVYSRADDDLRKTIEEKQILVAEIDQRKEQNISRKNDAKLQRETRIEIAKIEKELALRSLSPEEKRKRLQETKATLEKLETESERDSNFFIRREEARKEVERLTNLLNQGGASVAAEDQPTSVQIAGIEAKIADLKQRAGGRVRGRVVQETGVSLPGGGMLYQPGRRARGDIKKLQEALGNLRKEQESLSPAMRTIEDIILEDRTRAQAKEATISSLEKGLENLAAREREVSDNLQKLSSLPASDSRVAEIRSGLEEIQQNKREAEQTLTRIRESLQRDRDRIQESTNAWKGIKEARAGTTQRTTSEIIRDQIQSIKDEETKAMSIVTRMRATKVAPENLRAAQKTLDDIKASRNRWEERLRTERNSTQGRRGPRQRPSGPPPGGGTPPASPSSPRRPRPGSGGPGAGAATPPSEAPTPPPSAPSSSPSQPPSPTPSPSNSGASRGRTTTEEDRANREWVQSIGTNEYRGTRASAQQQTPRRSGTPTWLRKGLDDIQGGKGVPGQVTSRLRQYLNSRGVTNDEMAKMTPRQAWQRADEFSKGE